MWTHILRVCGHIHRGSSPRQTSALKLHLQLRYALCMYVPHTFIYLFTSYQISSVRARRWRAPPLILLLRHALCASAGSTVRMRQSSLFEDKCSACGLTEAVGNLPHSKPRVRSATGFRVCGQMRSKLSRVMSRPGMLRCTLCIPLSFSWTTSSSVTEDAQF
jgi:hypothetical protein